MEHAEDRLIELTEELQTVEREAREKADRLTQSRRRGAQGLTTAVTETLSFLDMPKVRFEVSIQPKGELCATGRDQVEFLIATNLGEPLLPMAKIASGGELARIMLSLKNVLNTCDGIQTVIFDEIDTGISGKTSRKVGIKLKEIGRSAQVICVTHSAQIAAVASTHWKISKSEVDGRSETSVNALNTDQRVDELSRILGGIEITETVRATAREMLNGN